MPESKEPTNNNEHLVGKVAICSKGRIGVITGRATLPWGESWVGVGFDGKQWASRSPSVIADNVNDYISGRMEETIAEAKNPSISEEQGDDKQSDDSLFGKVAVCSEGRIGIITGEADIPQGKLWIGIGFDGHPWSTRLPFIVADNLNDYVEEKTNE